MITQSKLALAISLAAIGSAADADISYSDIDSGDIIGSTAIVLAEGFPDVFDTPVIASGSNLLGASQQSFNVFTGFDPSSSGAISTLTGTATVNTQASDSVYSLDWSYEYSATFPSGMPSSSIIGFGSNMRLSHGINLAAGQTYEISWDGSGSSDFVTPIGTNLSSLVVQLTSANGSISDFTFGFNNPNATVTDAFVFQFTTTTAEQLTIDLDSQISVGIEEGAIVTSANAIQWGSFSIRVVPSPAGCGLLAIAGLTASRRRRA